MLLVLTKSLYQTTYKTHRIPLIGYHFSSVVNARYYDYFITLYGKKTLLGFRRNTKITETTERFLSVDAFLCADRNELKEYLQKTEVGNVLLMMKQANIQQHKTESYMKSREKEIPDGEFSLGRHI